MTERRGRDLEREVKRKQREERERERPRGRDRDRYISREDCLGVLDEQFGYAV
jgi:hypothetical protein